MIGRLRKARRVDAEELNITAFMNLMVVLVPFLLITAVFTQMAVKQLNLPDNSESQPLDEERRSLTLFVREETLTLEDKSGSVRNWPRIGDRFPFDAVNTALAEIKNAEPGEDSITLMIEPGVPYQTVIAAMDAVHYLPAARDGILVDMFPRISVGEATPLEQAP
ncbi:MAG: biopolymer transporter ExbD [Pseudomonadota bacterium]|jgi:biopolymer transport protein ExbD|nr:biopolymer transporter ExbD [Pseudomonadota bacterium]|tara:strand:- start:13594 stop:14088 length:495 start_codon:yes stop_codon:yes gene_type:complete